MTNEQTNTPNHGSSAAPVYVTLTGIPLTIEIEWPFHPSTSGADFDVVHADLKLADGSDLHAPVAVNLSKTVKEVLPSLGVRDNGSACDQCAAQGSGSQAD